MLVRHRSAVSHTAAAAACKQTIDIDVSPHKVYMFVNRRSSAYNTTKIARETTQVLQLGEAASGIFQKNQFCNCPE